MNTSQLKSIYEMRSSNLSLAESIAFHRNRIQKWERFIHSLFIVAEYLIYGFVFLWLYRWRVNPELQLGNPVTLMKYMDSLLDYGFLFVMIGIIYTALMIDKGLFRFYNSNGFVDDLFQIVKVIFVSFLIAIGVIFLLKTSVVYSRVLIVSYSLIMIVVSVLIRGVKKLVIKELSKKGILTKKVLIIGGGKVGRKVEEYIRNQNAHGYKIVGYLDDWKKGWEVIGETQDLEKVIERDKIDEIFITIPSEKKLIHQLLSRVRKYDVDIKIIPEMYDFLSSSIILHKTNVFPYMEIVKTPLKGFRLSIKRIFDLVVSLIGLIILSPLFAVIAVVIKLDLQGPVFFKQKRIGKNGASFSIYKFRSMVVNAEELKNSLKQQNEVDGPVFKIKKDPRVTRVGYFLRKYSIDELPQLFNVLKGDMSLIGPRPPVPEEVVHYTDYQWRRLDVRPGISGLWQVSGRSDLSFEECVNLDIYYIEHWSFILDLKILLRTIPVVLWGKGAY